MAKVKKVRCSAKTKEGKRCKNTASGKSAWLFQALIFC
jgi:hypothetical protein